MKNAPWPRVALNDVCEINPRRVARLVRNDDAPSTFVPMDAVDAVSGTIGKVLERPYEKVKKGYTYFETDDVLFAKITPSMENGKHFIGQGLIDDIGFASTEFHVLRPSRKILPEWVHFFLRQPQLTEALAENLTGTVGQQRLPDSFLRDLEIPLPPLAEQRRVAGLLKAQLAAVEKARRAAAERVEAAGALDGAVLREVFADAANGNWPMQELGEVAAIAAGIQKQPDRAPRKFHRPFLTVRNVQRGRLDLSQVEHFEITPAELDRLRLEDEDILVVEGNGSMDHIGRNALFQADGQEWIHQNHIIRVRMDRKRALPRFISYYLNSSEGSEQMLEKARTSSGLYTLSSGKVSALEVPLPPLKKQREVVERLEGITQRTRSVKSAAAAELAAIEALPGRLLGEVFG